VAITIKTKADPAPTPAPAVEAEEQIVVAGYTDPQQEVVQSIARPTKTSKNQGGPKKTLPVNMHITEGGKIKLKMPKAQMVNVLPKTKKGEEKKFSPEGLEGILAEGNLSSEFAPERQLPEAERHGHTRQRSTKEATQFRRMQVHRLVIRGVPRQTIAEHLGITLENLYTDIKIITSDMRDELRSMDYTMYIGMSMSFYDECRNIALRLATDTKEKSNGVKMQALRTAIAAEDAKHAFFARVGLFKVVSPTDPFNSIQTGRQGSYSDENDLNSLMQSIAQAAAGKTILDGVTRDVQDVDTRAD
jgi:hypothetical protein